MFLRNMGKRGGMAAQLLVMMILVVITSAVILFLVDLGVLEVDNTNQQSVLNTEFIPLQREGYLAVKDFSFCSKVNNNFDCQQPRTAFNRGEKVYMRYVVESSISASNVVLEYNFNIKNSEGVILYESKVANFEEAGDEGTKRVYIRDSFNIGEDANPGKYIMDIVVYNSLLNKKVVISENFIIV